VGIMFLSLFIYLSMLISFQINSASGRNLTMGLNPKETIIRCCPRGRSVGQSLRYRDPRPRLTCLPPILKRATIVPDGL
jgi:hypothetical protein